MFGNAQLFRFLRRDAGDEAGSGFRQVVHRRTTVPNIRLIREKVEIHVGAPTRKLHGAIQPLIQTERFIVVPINRRDCFGSHVGMSKKRMQFFTLHVRNRFLCKDEEKKSAERHFLSKKTVRRPENKQLRQIRRSWNNRRRDPIHAGIYQTASPPRAQRFCPLDSR